MPGASEVFDQNSDRVTKNDKSSHICSMRLKDGFGLIWNILKD